MTKNQMLPLVLGAIGFLALGYYLWPWAHDPTKERSDPSPVVVSAPVDDEGDDAAQSMPRAPVVKTSGPTEARTTSLNPTPREPAAGEQSSTLDVVLRTAAGVPVADAAVVLGRVSEAEQYDEGPGRGFMAFVGKDLIGLCRTNEDGVATFSDLPAGTYRISEGRDYLRPFGRQRDPVPRTGWYIPKDQKGRLLTMGALDVKIAIHSRVRREIVVRSTAAVIGRVVDAEGEPVHGVAVETRFESPSYSYGGRHHTRSREDGRFTLSDIAMPTQGDLFLRMQPPGFYGGIDVPGEKKIRLALKEGEVQDLGTVELETINGTVHGRLVDREGQPIVGTIVNLESSDLDGRGYSRYWSTRNDGSFRFVGVIPANYALTSRKHELVPEGQLEFRFPRGVRELDLGEVVADRNVWMLEGYLLLADGAPAAGARIQIDEEKELLADDRGRFSIQIEGIHGPFIEWIPAGEGTGAVVQEYGESTGPGGEHVFRARGLLIELRDSDSGELVSPRAVSVRRSYDGGTSTVGLGATGPRIRIQDVSGHHEVELRIDGYRTVTVPEAQIVGMSDDEEKLVVLELEKMR